MDKKYILYRHIRPDKEEIFYIGIGKKGRELDFKWGRNKHWRSIFNLNNGNIEVEVMLEDLSWEEACEKEREFIKLYGRKDLGLGTLCNMTNGGEGGFGRKWTEKQRDANRKMMETGHPMKGKKHSKEALKKISEASKGHKMNPEHLERLRKINKERPVTNKQRKSLDRTGSVPANARKIINNKTGEIFSSLQAAAKNANKNVITLKKYLSKDSEYNYL